MFINERLIDDNNWEKYGLPAIERELRGFLRAFEFTRPYLCTIDHERNIYLLHVAAQQNPKYDHVDTGLYGWLFFWRGHELWVEQKCLEAKGKRGEPGWARYLLSKFCLVSEKGDGMGESKRGLPPELKPHQEEILKDFHDALVAYREATSGHTAYELTLELAEGV
jgi:hypothetical protein